MNKAKQDFIERQIVKELEEPLTKIRAAASWINILTDGETNTDFRYLNRWSVNVMMQAYELMIRFNMFDEEDLEDE